MSLLAVEKPVFQQPATRPHVNGAILIVGPSWVGDMVMAQALCMLLARRTSGQDIDILAPRWSLPIIRRMPEVRTGIESPIGHGELALGRRFRLGRALRNRYAQAIVLPRSFKAALVPYFARIPLRTGYRGEMRYGLINDRRELEDAPITPTVTRFAALGMPANAEPPPVSSPRLDTDRVNQTRLAETLGLDPRGPVVALLPGAEYGPAKCWPVEHFGALAKQLAGVGCEIWILGSERDRLAGERIAGYALEASRNLCGLTRLEDAIDLLAMAHVVVTNDSGLMHVAAAVGTHVIALYGSSTPAYTPPLTESRTIKYLAIECSPCFERVCPLGHFRCLRGIDPAQVFEDTLRVIDDRFTHPLANGAGLGGRDRKAI
ncbi:MAG: lipopolysaccharide heptosyltransferase II [Gammaproteobacteria bacterium]|nr:lipopolysaccharide heptosyltransferase II [Gammaproteobacteria bacterium]